MRLRLACLVALLAFELTYTPAARSQEDVLDELLPRKSGCCSWHGGVSRCSGGRYVCRDGTYSPTCTCSSPKPTPTPDLRPFLPNKKLTPGEASSIALTDLCSANYSAPRLSKKQETAAFKRYRTKQSRQYVIDRLVPVEIGGTNGIKNLWPAPAQGSWKWSLKSKLNKKLRSLVCAGYLTLSDAQSAVAKHWIHYYQSVM